MRLSIFLFLLSIHKLNAQVRFGVGASNSTIFINRNIDLIKIKPRLLNINFDGNIKVKVKPKFNINLVASSYRYGITFVDEFQEIDIVSSTISYNIEAHYFIWENKHRLQFYGILLGVGYSKNNFYTLF